MHFSVSTAKQFKKRCTCQLIKATTVITWSEPSMQKHPRAQNEISNHKVQSKQLKSQQGCLDKHFSHCVALTFSHTPLLFKEHSLAQGNRGYFQLLWDKTLFQVPPLKMKSTHHTCFRGSKKKTGSSCWQAPQQWYLIWLVLNQKMRTIDAPLSLKTYFKIYFFKKKQKQKNITNSSPNSPSPFKHRKKKKTK